MEPLRIMAIKNFFISTGEQTIMRKLLAGLILATTAFPAFAIAVAPSPIPEPGALSLVGIGAVAGILVWAKNRNKNK